MSFNNARGKAVPKATTSIHIGGVPPSSFAPSHPASSTAAAALSSGSSSVSMAAGPVAGGSHAALTPTPHLLSAATAHRRSSSGLWLSRDYQPSLFLLPARKTDHRVRNPQSLWQAWRRPKHGAQSRKAWRRADCRLRARTRRSSFCRACFRSLFDWPSAKSPMCSTPTLCVVSVLQRHSHTHGERDA